MNKEEKTFYIIGHLTVAYLMLKGVLLLMRALLF